MDYHTTKARGRAVRFLLGLIAALGLAVPVLSGPSEAFQEKAEAARVAKKLKKAEGRAARMAEKEREAVRHFQKAVAKYADLHTRQLARLGDVKVVTAQVLADAITASRSKARPGDIFLPEIQPLLRRLIAEQLKGPDTLAAREAVIDGNPALDEDSVPVVVRVNGAYPSGASRSTVPPSLLLALPPLPPSLHYRFVGKDLILLDAVAQIIVDFVSGAAPGIPTK